MNILLINHYAGNNKLGMEYRPYYLANEWIKQGHNVLIVASSQAHVRSSQPDVKRNLQIDTIDGINYLWIKTNKYNGNGIGRIFNIFVFIIKLIFNKNKIIKIFKPDVVIASSTYPLDIFPANKIAKQCNAKLVFEVHDLWPLSPMELGGYSKNHPFIKVMQWAENFAYKKSDKVISILPNTLEHMLEHGLNPAKFHYIPNGIAMDEWQNCENVSCEHINLINKLKTEGKTVIGYAGSHGLANALQYLIQAADLLREEPVAFLFIGNGPDKETLKNQAAIMNLQNVFFLNAVPKKTLIPILKKIDILFISLQYKPIFRFGISPNKLFDYMMSGRPIIQAIKTPTDIVKLADCGITIEPENHFLIAETIKYFMQLTPDELSDIGARGKNYVALHHNYKVLAQDFINSIESI